MSKQVYFEDIGEGQELPPIEKKITMVNMFMYSASVWLIDRIHFDYLYATRRRNLPDAVMPGNIGVDFYSQFLNDWAGDEGRLSKISTQLRNFMCPEDTLKLGAKVLKKSAADGKGQVELELSMVNQKGINCVPGKAVVELPLRGK